MTLKVSLSQWNQTPDCLLQQSIQAAHPRTRERFSALYQVAVGATAVTVARKLSRHHETVTGWIHLYNTKGPEAMTYRRSGGHPPFARL